jgi:peptidoglycan/xylan/chitin deacetylase (PgdA/CDA1 family)
VQLADPISAVKPRELADGVAYAAITVDDAFCNFVLYAWPVLRARHIPVTVFVPTSYFGRRSAWVDYGGENPVGDEVITADTLRELAADPLIDIGSHTATHADLVKLTDDEVRYELTFSKQTLESILSRPVDSISFPYGSFGDRELRIAREVGYRYQFSVLPGCAHGAIREGLAGRVSVQPTDWPVEFRLKVLGAYRWMEKASRWKQRVWSGIGILTPQTKNNAHT